MKESRQTYNPSQLLSTSNWLKNQESYLKHIWSLIEGGLAKCAHTNKTQSHQTKPKQLVLK
jgi:hypothetical protein